MPISSPKASSLVAMLWREMFDVRSWKRSTLIMVGAALLLIAEIIIFSIFKVEPEVLSVALALPALTFVAVGLRNMGFHWSTVAVMLGALAMYGVYLTYTGHNERNLDVKAQVTYIEYIAKNFRAPPDNHCFICHHPPFYYSVAALVYGTTKWLGCAPPLRAVQILSMVSIFSLVLCTALIIRRFTARASAITLAAALVGLWPYTIIFSARIHNDVMAAALMAWTIYFCVRWYQQEERRALVGALVVGTLSVLTKMNGLEMIALILATVGFRALSKTDRLAYLKRVAPPIVVMALGLGAFIATRGSAKEKEEDKKEEKRENKDEKNGDDEGGEEGNGEEGEEQAPEEEPVAGERVFGSAFRIGQRSWMGNEPFNYFYFDIQNFLEEPYILARREGTGRQYFLNHWLKSSLFSTHNERADAETSYHFNHRIAQVENFLLLCMIAYFLIFIAQAKKADLKRQFVLVTAFLGFFAGAAGFRFLIPHSHHSDFRHAFTILMPFCIAYGLAVAHYRKRESSLEYVGYALAAIFLGLSIFYFTPKYEWVKRISSTVWIDKTQDEMSHRVKSKAKWNDKAHVILEATDALRMKLKERTDVHRFELGVDHNDTYRVTIIGSKERKVLHLGPHPKDKTRMADYDETFDPPIEGVKTIIVRPMSGDNRYAVGHMIVNAGIKLEKKVEKAETPPPKAEESADDGHQQDAKDDEENKRRE
jgi:hypothetical protein